MPLSRLLNGIYSLPELWIVFGLCADARNLTSVLGFGKQVAFCANSTTLSVNKQLWRKPRPEIRSANHCSNLITIPKQWTLCLWWTSLSVRSKHLFKHQCCQQAACQNPPFNLLTATSTENSPQLYLTWVINILLMTQSFIFTPNS